VTIEWRKEGDDYFGVEPPNALFDEMTWRVDKHRRVAFRVPDEPPYFMPAMSSNTESVVLASLDAYLLAETGVAGAQA